MKSILTIHLSNVEIECSKCGSKVADDDWDFHGEGKHIYQLRCKQCGEPITLRIDAEVTSDSRPRVRKPCECGGVMQQVVEPSDVSETHQG